MESVDEGMVVEESEKEVMEVEESEKEVMEVEESEKEVMEVFEVPKVEERVVVSSEGCNRSGDSWRMPPNNTAREDAAARKAAIDAKREAHMMEKYASK